MKLSHQVMLKPESRTFTAVQFLLRSSPAAPGWGSESPPQQSQQSASEGSCLGQTAGQRLRSLQTSCIRRQDTWVSRAVSGQGTCRLSEQDQRRELAVHDAAA